MDELTRTLEWVRAVRDSYYSQWQESSPEFWRGAKAALDATESNIASRLEGLRGRG